MTMMTKHIVRSFLSLVMLIGMSVCSRAMASPSAGNTYTITITKNFALADGIQQDIVTVVVSNAGNPVSGLDVTFIINGGASGINPVIATDVNGKAILSLSSTVAGPALVQAMVGGVIVGSVTVTFVAAAGPPDLTNPQTALIVDLGVNTADGLSVDKLHAHVVDVNGNPVAGVAVVFTVTGGTAGGTAVIVGSGITNSSGDAAITVTDVVAGSAAITATIGGLTINGDPATVFFVAGPPSLANPATKLIVDVGSTTADGVSTDQVHAHIVDVNGNPVSGVTVVFTVAGGSAGATAVIVGSGVTDVNGDAPVTITNTVAGTVLISATVGGTQINNSPATILFVAGAPSTSNPATQLIVDVPSNTADGVSTDQVHAHVVDVNGNPVSGTTVVFTVSGGTAGGTAVIVGTGITNAAGDAVLTITDVKAGTVDISATIGGVQINNSPATVTFVAGAPDPTNPLSQLIVDIGTTTADGVSFDQVHAHIVDANGNPVPNATVVFTIIGGTAAGTAVMPGSGTTNAGGDATINITDVTAGTVVLTARVNGNLINSNPATIIFTAGAPSPTNPASQLIVDVASNTADGVSTDKVHAHIVDATGNPVANVTVVFTVTGGTAGATAVIVGTGITNAAGDAVLTITNVKSGTVLIGATIGGTAINNSPATGTFVAGAPDLTQSMIVIDQDNSPTDGATPDILHAHIVDANGNPVPNQVVTFSLVSGTANFVGSFTVTTDAAGNAGVSLTSTVSGAVGVAAQIGAAALSNSPVTVHFLNMPDVTNPQTQLIVVVFEALADGTSTTSVKAHIVDQAGNVLPGQSVVFSIDSGNAQILTAQPVITDANGDAFITLSSSKPGDVLVTATVGGKPIVFGSPARVRFAAINIYVPRVFTPNGDGTNDVLKPILVGIAQFHYFSVYNRWGNLVFTTQDANIGWDGRFKGVLQPVETYLWIAEGIDNQGKKVVQKGMVSLVR
ncbi:MAG: Ig-like domain-containing protein [Bacteroidota bacterium]|nr:Ig-like domain-containing protein [Bacteroidota bacterium]